MDRRDDQSVELFRAFTAEEVREREHALISYGYRGEFCSGGLLV